MNNENITEKLIKEGLLRTSDDFTDITMGLIISKHTRVKLPFLWFSLAISSFVIFGLWSGFKDSDINFLSSFIGDSEVDPNNFLPLLLTIALLFINSFLYLKKEVEEL